MTADNDKSKPNSNWPKDEFGRSGMWSQAWFLSLIILLVVWIGALVFTAWHRAAAHANQVVVYCSQDQVYAEPIFKTFEQQTEIRVRTVYDNEAVKTVGLANRLLAERNHPQCDLFWGNEELRTRQLAAEGVFRAANGWAAFGYRSRRIVINTNRVSIANAPHSLFDLTNASWQGKFAVAYPQFGTTGTHFHALRQHWGDAVWESWCRGLAGNRPFLVDGNSVVVKIVAQGEAVIGLTDSDDIADGQREGLPVAMLPMNEESLLIPNTVALVRGGPHPQPAERLFAFLQRPDIGQRLVDARALEGVAVSEAQVASIKVNWEDLLRDLERTTAKLNAIFLR
jgi:iron(III) transport system substrate-binding protein